MRIIVDMMPRIKKDSVPKIIWHAVNLYCQNVGNIIQLPEPLPYCKDNRLSVQDGSSR